MSKALDRAIEKRADMVRMGASPENIQIMDARIARLTPATEHEPTEQPQPQAATVSPFELFLARLNGQTPQ